MSSTTEESDFGFWEGQSLFSSSTSRLDLGSGQAPIQWVRGENFEGKAALA
jgi:hypothetical protein